MSFQTFYNTAREIKHRKIYDLLLMSTASVKCDLKSQLDIELLKACHKYNVIPNFLQYRATNKTLKDLRLTLDVNS